MSTEEAERRKEALKEYFFALQIIDNFDNRALQIKSWSVTASGVAIGAAYVDHQPALFLLASVSAATFWFIEAMWKSFQRIVIERSTVLERFLNSNDGAYKGPEWSAHFHANFRFWRKVLRFPRVFFYTNTYLPHVLIVIVGAILFTDSVGITDLGSRIIGLLHTH